MGRELENAACRDVCETVYVVDGLVKERKVPPSEIDRAVALRKRFEEDPESHTVRWER